MRRGTGGFTLIELMIVVVIAGVLVSVAAPAFLKYVRKAKTSEAVENVRRMYESSRSYILEESTGRGTASPPVRQFPATEGLTPAASCCGGPGDKCAPEPSDWDTATWHALHFAMDDPHYFRYAYDSAPGAGFTARAQGDLDCDGATSTFEMVGTWSPVNRDVQGSAGVFHKDELE